MMDLLMKGLLVVGGMVGVKLAAPRLSTLAGTDATTGAPRLSTDKAELLLGGALVAGAVLNSGGYGKDLGWAAIGALSPTVANKVLNQVAPGTSISGPAPFHVGRLPNAGAAVFALPPGANPYVQAGYTPLHARN